MLAGTAMLNVGAIIALFKHFNRAGIEAIGHSDEFLEESAVVDHGAAQFFSCGPAAGPAERDIVGGAIVLRDDGMVDGDVGGALLEVANGIAAGGHDIAKQLIGFSDSSGGRVDEMSLNAAPPVDVPGALNGV